MDLVIPIVLQNLAGELVDKVEDRLILDEEVAEGDEVEEASKAPDLKIINSIKY
jgi:hypothetical protein